MAESRAILVREGIPGVYSELLSNPMKVMGLRGASVCYRLRVDGGDESGLVRAGIG
jgi:hypothetical protein